MFKSAAATILVFFIILDANLYFLAIPPQPIIPTFTTLLVFVSLHQSYCPSNTHFTEFLMILRKISFFKDLTW